MAAFAHGQLAVALPRSRRLPPRDEYRVAGLIHPNIWHGHGPWQVHTWLADCVRAGLLLPAPVEGWQATLIASDLILGDHGATTCYGAALGSPVLLAAFPEQDVAVGSVGDVLGRTAPRLSRREPLRRQVERAFTEHSPNRFDALRDLVTSCPGEAAQRLRALCYGHLRLPEPSRQPVVPVVPAEAVASPHHQPVMADHIVCTPSGEEHPHYVIGRFPAELQVDQADERHLDDAVLMVHEDHPQQSLLSQAVVVFLAEAGPDETLKAAFGKAVRRHRGALLLALPSSDGYLVCSRDGNLVEIAGERAELGVAVLHEWRLATGDGSIPPEEVSITVGGTRSTVRLRVAEAVELLP